MTRPHGFPPIVNQQAQTLILGSLPSIASIEKNQYYGNPRNQFWHILYCCYDLPAQEAYEAKRAFLLSHQIALWDVLQSAQRQGSLDSAIKDEHPNDIGHFLCDYPNIRRILFNGTKAEQMFRKHCKDIHLPQIKLPSTSPMRGKNVKELPDKIADWKHALLEF